MKAFRKYQLNDRVLDAIQNLGYRHPTRVQEKVIPSFLQGHNLIVEAPTGTGKTAAYGLPLISTLDLLKRSTQALVMLPTRELAIQVANALQSFYNGSQLQVACVFGGVPLEESFAALKSGAHIMVVVPGRLRDVMSRYRYDYLWRDIRFLIADEGDKLLEMGFQHDFDEIRKHVRSTAQVGFFSATIPADIEAVIRERIHPVSTIRLSPREVLSNIRFLQVEVSGGGREGGLAALLKEESPGQALVFCSRREDIYGVTGFLRKAGFRAESYYGNQPQEERIHILDRFKEGLIDFLVASDLAARGLDVPDLPAVINLGIPEEYDFYLHRIGRTGRAGQKGRVYNLISGKKESIFLRNHHQKLGLPLKKIRLEALSQDDLPTEEKRRVRAMLTRGKRDKVSKGDVLGFLLAETGLKAEEIGTITLSEAYALVDIPQQALNKLQALEGLRLKGKTVKLRAWRQEAQQKKDRAAYQQKKDRRKG